MKGQNNNETLPNGAGDHPLLGLGRVLPRREGKLFFLSDAGQAFLVLAGKADLFLIPPDGRRRPLARIEAGSLMMGLGDAGEGGMRVLAVGDPDARLLAIDRRELEEKGAEPEYNQIIARLLAGWLNQMAQGLNPGLPPKDAVYISQSGAAEIPAGRAARPSVDAIFVRYEGKARIAGRKELTVQGGGGYIPLPDEIWLTPAQDLSLESLTIEDYLKSHTQWEGLDRYNRVIFRALGIITANQESLEEKRLQKKRLLDESLLNRAYQRIAEIFNPDRAPEVLGAASWDHLYTACRMVGREMGIDFKSPLESREDEARERKDIDKALLGITRAARVRKREVALRGRWWDQDMGPLLAFMGEDKKPVALLPVSPGSYAIADPESGSRATVDEAQAAQLHPFAVAFYRSLAHRALAGRELIRFGFRGCRIDRNIVLTMVLVAGVLGLVTPLATEVIFSEVIPKANMSYLWQVSLILLVCYLAGGALNMVRDFGVLRIAGKMESSLESAVWDRLLNLPAPFFRKYPSGDLTLRAMGINTIRQLASNVVVTNTLGGLASSLNLLLMFYYSWKLALIGICLVIIAVGATVVTTRAQLRHQRRVFDIQGKISALVIQLVNGINKLRTAGAEDRAFAVWARKFSAQKSSSLKAGKISNILQAINAGFPVLSTAAIFAWLVFYDKNQMEMSEFLAFNTAFGTFLQSCLMMSTSLIAMLNAVPVYERLRPIVEAEPETDPAKAKPGELSGLIVINKAAFRYQADGPVILHSISLNIEPGEFVALVGPSGSGKSTMLRLLLGFESLEEGSIFYDQYDLSRVDPHEIRRQIGVVLQSAQLMTGTIFSNIAGSSNLSQEHAWEAARLAGFEKDILAMPMGMETMVSEGGSTLSGGQRQRLLIARALIKKPRIIFFDEATSALDNQTQSVVGKSLEQLRATRLVIAHRLSTVINADRIVVLKEGRIVEQGAYEQLMALGGEFARLAKRQLA